MSYWALANVHRGSVRAWVIRIQPGCLWWASACTRIWTFSKTYEVCSCCSTQQVSAGWSAKTAPCFFSCWADSGLKQMDCINCFNKNIPECGLLKNLKPGWDKFEELVTAIACIMAILLRVFCVWKKLQYLFICLFPEMPVSDGGMWKYLSDIFWKKKDFSVKGRNSIKVPVHAHPQACPICTKVVRSHITLYVSLLVIKEINKYLISHVNGKCQIWCPQWFP